MPLISTGQITKYQNLLKTALDQTATIQRNTQTRDAGGGVKNGWTNLTTNVPCLIHPLSTNDSEQIIAAQLEGISGWRLDFAIGTDVTIADRVIALSKTFEVVGVVTPESYQVCVSVIAKVVA